MEKSPSTLMFDLYTVVDKALHGKSDEKIGEDFGNKPSIPGVEDVDLHAYASLLYVDQLIDGKTHEKHSADVKNLDAIKDLLRIDMWVDAREAKKSDKTKDSLVHEEKHNEKSEIMNPDDLPKTRRIFSPNERHMAAKSATYTPTEAALNDVMALLEIDQQMDGYKKTQSQHDELGAIQDLLVIDLEIDRKSALSTGDKLGKPEKKTISEPTSSTTQRRSIFTAQEKMSVRDIGTHGGLNIGKI